MFPEASPALHNFILAALLAPTLLGIPPSDAHSAKRLAVKAKVACCPRPPAIHTLTPLPALSWTPLALSSICRENLAIAAAMLTASSSCHHYYCYCCYSVQKQPNRTTLLDRQDASIAANVNDGTFLSPAGYMLFGELIISPSSLWTVLFIVGVIT